jgi:hypothetical protein
MLGEFGGSVLNDATEAGIRQSRNNQARPILIDEFEPDQSVRNGSKQDGMFALFRRMSGGEGGRVSRGGADHSAVSFRTLGAAYVTSINHIQLADWVLAVVFGGCNRNFCMRCARGSGHPSRLHD